MLPWFLSLPRPVFERGGRGAAELERRCLTTTGGVDLKEFCLSMRWNQTQYMTKAHQSMFLCGVRKSLSKRWASFHECCFSLSAAHIFPLFLLLLKREPLTDAVATVRTQTVTSFNSSLQIYYNRSYRCSTLSLVCLCALERPQSAGRGSCEEKRKSQRITITLGGENAIFYMSIYKLSEGTAM